jgi:hypothetical protein
MDHAQVKIIMQITLLILPVLEVDFTVLLMTLKPMHGIITLEHQQDMLDINQLYMIAH